MLRAAKPALRAAMLVQGFKFPFWYGCLSKLHRAFWFPYVSEPTTPCAALATGSGQWYVGKTQTSRVRIHIPWCGGVARYQEQYDSTC
eukprot:54320-Pyramimonas_sp.AAC.1